MDNAEETVLAARGIVDTDGCLLSADEPLAELQQKCGGLMPGAIAVPELRALATQCMTMQLRIAREFSAFDGADTITGYVRVNPAKPWDGGGCEILIQNWHRQPAETLSSHDLASRLDAIDRVSAEATAWLDADQRLLGLATDAADVEEFKRAVAVEPGQHWTKYVSLSGVTHRQPLHWRLLDGSECELPGSERSWRCRILPAGPVSVNPQGFELLLIADRPLAPAMGEATGSVRSDHSNLIGGALTPVLRQPISRIIANAETIRARLAGPLRDDYADYAGNIALAGQHLGAMLDDLADIETLDAPDFTTAREKVDLADAAQRAAGILGVRARAKDIAVELHASDDPVIASADFRRVLQILINLIGNAIAYSSEGSLITITVAPGREGQVCITIADQGPGVSADQAERIFEKFERLGRDSDGGKDQGSGLGLYISRRLARAMGGDLTVAPANPGNIPSGAAFTLSLPSAS